MQKKRRLHRCASPMPLLALAWAFLIERASDFAVHPPSRQIRRRASLRHRAGRRLGQHGHAPRRHSSDVYRRIAWQGVERCVFDATMDGVLSACGVVGHGDLLVLPSSSF